MLYALLDILRLIDCIREVADDKVFHTAKIEEPEVALRPELLAPELPSIRYALDYARQVSDAYAGTQTRCNYANLLKVKIGDIEFSVERYHDSSVGGTGVMFSIVRELPDAPRWKWISH